MAAAAGAGRARTKNKQGKKGSFVPKRGQVLKRVLGSLFSWLPRCCSRLSLFRRNRAPRARRGNRVPANGGHVEPEPDVANNTAAPFFGHPLTRVKSFL